MSQEKKNAAGKQAKNIDYLFISGVLALDLVNTEVVVRGKKRDLLSSPHDLAPWWQEAINRQRDKKLPVSGTF